MKKSLLVALLHVALFGCSTTSPIDEPERHAPEWWAYMVEDKLLDPELSGAVDPVTQEPLFGTTKVYSKFFNSESKCRDAYRYEVGKLESVRWATEKEIDQDWQLQVRRHKFDTLGECQRVDDPVTLNALHDIDNE